MKIRKNLMLLASAVASVAAFGLTSGTAFAAGQNCTWTGSGSDDNWSTTANWSGCGGAAPANGDNLVFPGTASRKLNVNNLSGRTFANITFSGTTSGFNLSGNAFTLTGGITDNGTATNSGNSIYNDITFSGDQSIGGTHSTSGGVTLVLGDNSAPGTTTLSSGTLTVTGSPSVTFNSALSGSGNLIFESTGGGGLTHAASGFSGNTTLRNNTFVSTTDDSVSALGTGHITVESGSTLSMISNQSSVTLPNAFTLAGNGIGNVGALSVALGSCPGGTCSSSAEVKLAGSLTLTGNTSVSAAGSRFVVAGTYTPNGFTLTALTNSTLVLPSTTPAPKAPNTGFAAVQSNPLVTLAVTAGSALALVLVALRFRKTAARR
jgi:hypothetical protein